MQHEGSDLEAQGYDRLRKLCLDQQATVARITAQFSCSVDDGFLEAECEIFVKNQAQLSDMYTFYTYTASTSNTTTLDA